MDAHKQRMRQSSVECDWRTPPEMVAALSRSWSFDLDLAASRESAVVTHYSDGEDCPVYLGPDHPDDQYQNALTTPWHLLGKVGFLNPPYSLTLYSEGLKAGKSPAELAYLRIEAWAWKAYQESLHGFTTIGVFPYASQTEWFREYVMGHTVKLSKANSAQVDWAGHAALDCWRLPHRVSYLRPDGSPAANANVNTCVIIWGPNPGFVGPWAPSGRFWSYR